MTDLTPIQRYYADVISLFWSQASIELSALDGVPVSKTQTFIYMDSYRLGEIVLDEDLSWELRNRAHLLMLGTSLAVSLRNNEPPLAILYGRDYKVAYKYIYNQYRFLSEHAAKLASGA